MKWWVSVEPFAFPGYSTETFYSMLSMYPSYYKCYNGCEYIDPWMKFNMLLLQLMLDAKVRDIVMCFVLFDGFCPFNVPLHLLRGILPPTPGSFYSRVE